MNRRRGIGNAFRRSGHASRIYFARAAAMTEKGKTGEAIAKLMFILERGFSSHPWKPHEALEKGLELAGAARFIVLPGNAGALLATTTAPVNGAAPPSLTILSHRDELAARGRLLYFVADAPLRSKCSEQSPLGSRPPLSGRNRRRRCHSGFPRTAAARSTIGIVGLGSSRRRVKREMRSAEHTLDRFDRRLAVAFSARHLEGNRTAGQ